MWRSATTLSILEIAVPSATRGERLKETVTAGNWPCRVMANGSVVFSKCVKVLSGTALEEMEVAALTEPVPAVLKPVLLLGVIAVLCAPSTLADGEKRTVAVVAFDPAEDDPEAAKDEDAPGPLVPCD